MTPEREREIRALAAMPSDRLTTVYGHALHSSTRDLLAEVERLRAIIDAAETSLGRAWMHGDATLAQGIARKTAAMERLAR